MTKCDWTQAFFPTPSLTNNLPSQHANISEQTMTNKESGIKIDKSDQQTSKQQEEQMLKQSIFATYTGWNKSWQIWSLE